MIPPIMASTTYVDWRLCCFNAVVSVKEIQQNDRIAWGNPYLKNWPVFQSDAGSLKVSFDETKIINHNHYTFTIFTPISTIVFTTIIIIFLTIIIVYVQNWLPQMIRKASVNEEVELFILCTLFVIIAIQQKVALTNNISPYTRKFYNKKNCTYLWSHCTFIFIVIDIFCSNFLFCKITVSHNVKCCNAHNIHSTTLQIVQSTRKRGRNLFNSWAIFESQWITLLFHLY